MLEEKIKQRRATLEGTKIDIQILYEYKKLREELNAQGLSLKDPRILLSVLKTIREIGYEPQKIVREFSRIKSLRQLNNSCKALESWRARSREVLPLCEQVMHARIGFPELLALHDAVTKKADLENLSMGTAAYSVMEDIENYNRLGGLKKQLLRYINAIIYDESNFGTSK